ncbi:MAG TPA: hypothetical protein VL221_01135 [Bacteroidota bacterium]|nr:hypothetical protein [Bacteroidota bacterium]
MGMVTEMRIPGADAPAKERFNYRGMHRYLITLLPHPGAGTLPERETVLSTLDALRGACRTHGFEVYAYCFMPDRLVLLVRGREESSDMKLFLAGFRAASASAHEERTGKRLWSRRYRERVLRKTEVTRTVAEEIFRAPVTARLASAPGTYAYQGSFVLAGVPPPRRRPPAHRPAGKRPRPLRRH